MLRLLATMTCVDMQNEESKGGALHDNLFTRIKLPEQYFWNLYFIYKYK